MRVLDLFCCAGGAARGYQLAGATVRGVDIVPRPNYCGEQFFRGDALRYLSDYVESTRLLFDLVHTSPPCQAGCTLTNGTNKANGWGADHEQFVPRTRELLDAIGLPYVIEQPAGHGGLIRRDLMLCMDMHELLPVPLSPPWVIRHRDFEISGFTVPQPMHRKHRGYVRGMRHGVVRDGPYVAAYGSGGGKATVAEMQHALCMDWTTEREELTEAIPPAYTRHIGQFFAASLAQSGRLDL